MEDVLRQDTQSSNDKDFTDNAKLNSAMMHLEERILDISTQHSLNVLKTPPTKKAKRVRFFRNGDRFYTGVVMAVTPERYRSFDSLASDLTRALISSVTLPNGVRAIYTMDGKKVQSVSDLEDGKCYVVSGQGEIFKKVEYSAAKVKRGGSLSGLPQPGAGRQTSAIPLCVKARIITLIRNGIKPRKVIRLLLNKRNAPSWEHAMEAITEAVKLDSGAVRKVYTLSGQPITTLEQFFEQDDVFIAYGSEKSTQEDFELDFEESKYVQSFRRCSWTSKRQSGPMPRMPRKSGKKTLTTPQVRTPSPSTLILPQPLRMHYTVGLMIGDGNFAVVRHCVHKSTGTEYAIKIIDKYKCQGKESMLASEVAILQQVSHPNIIRLIAEHETTDQLFLVMELMRGGDLFDAIAASTKFSEADASIMIGHLTSALAYLHSHHIVHRDVKPENLLVKMDHGHVKCLKLGDFGLAQVVTKPLYTVCGTPTYVAPEILAETGYGLKIDVWAAGVILYILLCGFPPFVSPENEQEELFERILSGQYEFTSPYWDDISDSAKQLISNMLQPQPELRFSAEDVLDHPWLTSFLGGEQAGTPILTTQAKQFWDQQSEPVMLEVFDFGSKENLELNTEDGYVNGTPKAAGNPRSKWNNVSSSVDATVDRDQSTDIVTTESDDGRSNSHLDKEMMFLSRDKYSIRSIHSSTESFEENHYSQQSLKSSRSATHSLSSIPEYIGVPTPNSMMNLSSRHSNSIPEINVAYDENSTEETVPVRGKKPLSTEDSHNCEELSSRRTLTDKRGYEHNYTYRYSKIISDIDTPDYPSATVKSCNIASSPESLTSGNGTQASTSFIELQSAQLSLDHKTCSAESIESTASFENVTLNFDQNSEKNKSAKNASCQAICKDRENPTIPTNFINSPVSTRTSTTKKTLRYSCGPRSNKKLLKNEEESKTQSKFGLGKGNFESAHKVPSDSTRIDRKFSSTDELTNNKEEQGNKTKRFSLYYTPQLPRKIYETNREIGLSTLKNIVKKCSNRHSHNHSQGECLTRNIISDPSQNKSNESPRSLAKSSGDVGKDKVNKHCIYLRSKGVQPNAIGKLD